mmetsp:Transcript_23413/g.69279  ORF Transcript_23413/g.69279 Transcript_23413/m.69279 type:complete len:232 (-) Transcript_23413:5210-5905(-)
MLSCYPLGHYDAPQALEHRHGSVPRCDKGKYQHPRLDPPPPSRQTYLTLPPQSTSVCIGPPQHTTYRPLGEQRRPQLLSSLHEKLSPHSASVYTLYLPCHGVPPQSDHHGPGHERPQRALNDTGCVLQSGQTLAIPLETPGHVLRHLRVLGGVWVYQAALAWGVDIVGLAFEGRVGGVDESGKGLVYRRLGGFGLELLGLAEVVWLGRRLAPAEGLGTGRAAAQSLRDSGS